MKKKSASILWTGGKDSCLALYEAHLANYRVVNLVTLAPPNPDFLAHPIPFMKLQSEALHIPHVVIEITPPYKKNYIKAFTCLKEKFLIDTVITGDIDQVAGHPNLSKECAEETNLEMFQPLWKKDRKEIMNKFLEYKFQWMFSLVKIPYFTAEWVGRTFTEAAYTALLELKKNRNIDICGENGEYHTLVLDTDLFRKKISIDEFVITGKQDMHYIDIKKMSLRDK